MQKLILPFSEAVNYVRDIVDDLPKWHRLPSDGKAREEIICNAVAAFTTAVIMERLRYLRKKPDPMVEFLAVMGYSVREWSIREIDEFCADLDDLFLDLIILTDIVVDPLIGMIGSRAIEIYHDNGQEELVVTIGEDNRIERYRKMIQRLPVLRMPKVIRGVEDLDSIDEYFNDTIRPVFERISHPTVKEEVKRMLLEIAQRQ